MSLRARAAALLASALMAAGCGTVFHGSRQTLEIRTTPPGATAVILPEGLSLQTPAEVELRRKLAHTVRLELDGYCRETVLLDRVASGARYGNLFGGLVVAGPFGVVVAAGVDAQTGAAYRLTPDFLEVGLRPLDASGGGHGCPPFPSE